MTAWKIRPAAVGDARSLARIHADAFAGGLISLWDERDYAGWLDRPGAFCLVAGKGEAIDAFGLALAAGDDAELLILATAPQSQRAGAARIIFRALDEAAASRGLRRWVFEVARNNLPALALYEREGFVEIAVRPDYYHQEGRIADALVLARPVGPGRPANAAD